MNWSRAGHERNEGFNPGVHAVKLNRLQPTIGLMAKQRNRRRETAAPTPFEQARDELFQHIMRCGVIQAVPEHQEEWFNDTMPYLQDRYPELSDAELTELRTLGSRFCQPPKAKSESEATEAADTQEAVEAADAVPAA